MPLNRSNCALLTSRPVAASIAPVGLEVSSSSVAGCKVIGLAIDVVANKASVAARQPGAKARGIFIAEIPGTPMFLNQVTQ